MLRSNAMTIGQLSRRSGVPIKVLRDYEDLGFLYTLGRSESTYRLFGEEALWCVQVIQGLRSLGLTLKEIQALVTCYLERPGEPSVALLEAQLAHRPGPLHQPWCSCWRETHAIVQCNLPLDSPLGGKVYTRSGAAREIVNVSCRNLEQAEI